MKLRNKLILSCAALAAVATTAVSTTFAWYTANESVKAQGITGQTSSDDDTLLLISKSGKQGSWSGKVSVDTHNVVLAPVSYQTVSGTAGYYLWDSTNNAVDTTAEGVATACGDAGAGGDYISFVLYFKSGSSQDLNVNIESVALINTTGGGDADTAPTLPAKTVLAAGTGSSDLTYTINMFRAVKFVTTIGNGTEVASNNSTPAAVPAGAARTPYKLDSLVTADSDSFVASGSTASNAHTYYNNVKGAEIATDIDGSEQANEVDFLDSTNGFGTVGHNLGHTGPGATTGGAVDPILVVKIDMYLDGWDKACFDACRGQSFSLAMTFAATNYTAPTGD